MTLRSFKRRPANWDRTGLWGLWIISNKNKRSMPWRQRDSSSKNLFGNNKGVYQKKGESMKTIFLVGVCSMLVVVSSAQAHSICQYQKSEDQCNQYAECTWNPGSGGAGQCEYNKRLFDPILAKGDSRKIVCHGTNQYAAEITFETELLSDHLINGGFLLEKAAGKNWVSYVHGEIHARPYDDRRNSFLLIDGSYRKYLILPTVLPSSGTVEGMFQWSFAGNPEQIIEKLSFSCVIDGKE